jgi:DNA-binding NarL/FixJ family response regulator
LIRVVILADTVARALSLAELVAEDERFEVLEASSAIDHRSLGTSMPVDVVVAACLAPERLAQVDVPVVLLDDQPPGASLRSPVRAHFPLRTSPAEIAAAIEAAAHQLTTLTEEQAALWLHGRDSDADADFHEELTPRELEILRMLADGSTNKEIGNRLGISDHTAKFHVAQILAKLRAAGRAEAVAIGIRRGLVPL